MAEFTLTILGSGSALPMHGRHPSAQLIQYDDWYCLVDCGEGTYERMMLGGIKPFRIQHILISHLHGDHVFGLPGLLSSFSHLKRTEELTVYGPIGIKGFLESIFRFSEVILTYPLIIIESEITKLTSIFSQGNIEVLSFPLYHRIACNGYIVKEKSSPIHLQKELIHSAHLSNEQMQSLKRGEDIRIEGEIVQYEKFTRDHVRPISYAYCSDTRYDLRLLSWIEGVTVLYHETTFMDDMAKMAELTGHSTAGEAGKIASAAEVTCLITGHYSSRYKDAGLLVEEAKTHFGYVLQAEEGKKYSLRNLVKGVV
jgi:ribonuclease Z